VTWVVLSNVIKPATPAHPSFSVQQDVIGQLQFSFSLDTLLMIIVSSADLDRATFSMWSHFEVSLFQGNTARRKTTARPNLAGTGPSAPRWGRNTSANVPQDSRVPNARTTRTSAGTNRACTASATTHTAATRKWTEYVKTLGGGVIGGNLWIGRSGQGESTAKVTRTGRRFRRIGFHSVYYK
jgi:hypothetical protein